MNERVGSDVGEPLARLEVVDDGRLLGDIAAGHHQRRVDVLQKQKMERGRRQHEAERVETGGDAVGQASWAVSAQQDDRGLSSRELALLLGTSGTILANDVEVARHEGKWLARAPFQLPQLRDRFGIAGIAGQMVAADPFDCDDLSGTDQVGGPFDVVARGGVGIAGCASQCDQFCRRATARTGNRFGVKATVAGIAVFSATV